MRTEKTLTLKEFSKLNGLNYRTVWARMKKGLSCMQAVTFNRRDKTSVDPRNHGLRNSPAYSSWCSMKMRCKKDFDYVSRGIKVCDLWMDFREFYKEMGPRPEGTSLDRIDNSIGYWPGNCRWATPAVQARNQSSNVMLEYNGVRQCATDWERELGFARGTIRQRLNGYGFSIKDAIEMKRFEKRKK